MTPSLPVVNLRGDPDVIGATGLDSVKCVLREADRSQNLVHGFFQVSGVLFENPSARFTIKSNANILVSIRMEPAKKMAGQTALYSFEIRRDLLKNACISATGPGRWVELDLGTVRVLAAEEYRNVDLFKVFQPSQRSSAGQPDGRQ